MLHWLGCLWCPSQHTIRSHHVTGSSIIELQCERGWIICLHWRSLVSRMTQSELCARPLRNSYVGDNQHFWTQTLCIYSNGSTDGELVAECRDHEAVGPVRSSGCGCGIWRLEGCDSARRGSSASNSRRSTALIDTLPQPHSWDIYLQTSSVNSLQSEQQRRWGAQWEWLGKERGITISIHWKYGNVANIRSRNSGWFVTKQIIKQRCAYLRL